MSGKVQNFEMENVIPGYVALSLLSNNNWTYSSLHYTTLQGFFDMVTSGVSTQAFKIVQITNTNYLLDSRSIYVKE